MDSRRNEPQLGDAISRMKEAVLCTPGDTEPGVRREIEVRIAKLSGRLKNEPPTTPSASAAESLPPSVVRYVDKVGCKAFSITDDDIESLTKLGYSDDAVFEITLSAALGAALGRLQRGLSALEESE